MSTTTVYDIAKAAGVSRTTVLRALWGKEGIAIDNPQQAIRYALNRASKEDAIFIGGSNYLVGEAINTI